MARQRPRDSGNKPHARSAGGTSRATVAVAPPTSATPPPRKVELPAGPVEPPAPSTSGPHSAHFQALTTFVCSFLCGGGLASFGIAILHECLWHVPHPVLAVQQIGLAALLALLGSILFSSRAAGRSAGGDDSAIAGNAVHRSAVWLLACGSAASLAFIMLRQMEAYRSFVAGQFLLPADVFCHAVAAPLVILGAAVLAFATVAIQDLALKGEGHARGMRAVVPLAMLLGGGLGVGILIAGESFRPAVYLSLLALFGAGGIGATVRANRMFALPRPTQRRRNGTPHSSTGGLNRNGPPVPPMLCHVIALAAAASLAALVGGALVDLQRPRECTFPMLLLLAASVAGSCAALGPRGGARLAIAALLALLGAGAAFSQRDFGGLQRLAVQMAGAAAACGALVCATSVVTRSAGGRAWPARFTVLAGISVGLWLSAFSGAREQRAPAAAEAGIPWAPTLHGAAGLATLPKAEIYSAASAWFLDAGGPRADVLLIRSEPEAPLLSSAPLSDPQAARRLAERMRSSVRAGGRMVLELPAPTLSEVVLRDSRKPPRSEAFGAFVVRMPRPPGADAVALIVGSDVPAWLARTIGQDTELAVYPIANKTQLAALLAASSRLP